MNDLLRKLDCPLPVSPAPEPLVKELCREIAREEENPGASHHSDYCMDKDTNGQNQSLLSSMLCDSEILSRPILVGYAFGPKKMSTMGVVMAEASKAHLSTLATTVLVEETEEDEAADNDGGRNDGGRYVLVCADDDDEYDQKSASQKNQSLQLSQDRRIKNDNIDLVVASDAVDTTTTARTADPAAANNGTPRSYPPTNSHSMENNNILLSLDSYSGGLRNIVRYLHSSCSSVDTNSTSTTLLTTGTTITGVTPSSASTSGGMLGASASGTGSATGQSHEQQRLRVSFVPLDPDFPLEGQHGAKMDIILHKLTEDILCLSKFSPLFPNIVPNLGNMNGELKRTLEEACLPCEAQAAILRVHRLIQYQKKYPDCSLADDPSKVLTLMSRSDIAHALELSLVGVTSKSGIPVASPKFVVLDPERTKVATARSDYNQPADRQNLIKDRTISIAQCLKEANMSYPLIAKPLQAAGTKTSHYMTVLLNKSSLDHIHDSSCLLQEYVNHDAVLYKVYVLGNNVRVYQRPSLPNLPPLDSTSRTAGMQQGRSSSSPSPSYVDFDSQRPYPRLSAFGVVEGKHARMPPPPFLSSLTAASPSSASSTTSASVAVTAEEVQPIVDTLKKAFGLELFGFDILITSACDKGRIAVDDDGDGAPNKRQMLVVDVNYFPSYKEVLNFPSLLAQYLTQRAVDSRRNQAPPTS